MTMDSQTYMDQLMDEGEARRQQPLTVFQLTFGELFGLCFKIEVALILAGLIISIPVALIAWE